ncbi:MAG TPA: hypothetical protein VFU88_13360 [Ktedonobacterales bacterium]|nr:hypothetical protein [Ktedonobacterales bacterium]
MLRRVELGAGIAAGALAVLGFVALLFAPLPTCAVAVPSNGKCPASAVRYATLTQLNLETGAWLYLLALVALLLVGAAGAIAEARFGQPRGAAALWVGLVLGFTACAFSALGAGLFFLPALLALALAGYASLLRRMRARRTSPET